MVPERLGAKMAKILVVEDTDIAWVGLSLLLESHGVRREDMTRARWYSEAEAMIRSVRFDVVFLDHRMPMHDPGMTQTEDRHRYSMALKDVGYLLIPLIKQICLETVVVGTSSGSDRNLADFPKPDFDMKKSVVGDIPPEILGVLKK